MYNSILETRIQSLERQVRSQRLLISGLLVTALAVVGIAAATSDVSNEIKTKRLSIVNDKGEQVLLATSEKDGGVLALFNGQGLTPVFIAGGRPTGGELLVKNASGLNMVEIMEDKGGGRVSVSAGGSMHRLGDSGTK